MKGVFNASVFMGRPLYPADITTVVSVYNAETDVLVPTLWLDRDGSQELANPHPLSEDGVILFYVDPGRYNITVEKGTDLYREWPDVIISDSATSGTPGIQSVVAGTNVTVDDTDPLNPVVSATGGGGSVVFIAVSQSSHGFSDGDSVYFDGSEWALARADSITTLGTHVVSGSTVNEFDAVSHGVVSGLSGLIPGAWYYVSTATAGAVTATEPITGYSNPIGQAMSTTAFYVFPFRAQEL